LKKAIVIFSILLVLLIVGYFIYKKYLTRKNTDVTDINIMPQLPPPVNTTASSQQSGIATALGGNDFSSQKYPLIANPELPPGFSYDSSGNVVSLLQ
jgi:hypothetical protein